MTKTQTPADDGSHGRRGGYDPQRYARIIRPAKPPAQTPEQRARLWSEHDAMIRRAERFFDGDHDDG